MFSISATGQLTRDTSRFAGLVEASLPEIRDFWGLNPESRVEALSIPDLIASVSAPTTRYSYELHYSKYYC